MNKDNLTPVIKQEAERLRKIVHACVCSEDYKDCALSKGIEEDIIKSMLAVEKETLKHIEKLFKAPY